MLTAMQKLRNERLRQYVDAESAILAGQSYTIGNRTLTRANLATVRNAIEDLLAVGATLGDNEASSLNRTKQVVLRDF